MSIMTIGILISIAFILGFAFGAWINQFANDMVPNSRISDDKQDEIESSEVKGQGEQPVWMGVDLGTEAHPDRRRQRDLL